MQNKEALKASKNESIKSVSKSNEIVCFVGANTVASVLIKPDGRINKKSEPH